MKSIQNIWAITREYGDLAGAGGVKDVARQLAKALAKSGRQVSVVLPLYGFMDAELLGFKPCDLSFMIDLSYANQERREQVTIWQKGVSPAIYLIDSSRFREKQGVYTYTAAEDDGVYKRQGKGHYDYFAMNVLLQKAALALIIHLGERPDTIHCHDGHTALVPALIHEHEGYRHYFHNTGCVVTIHNAGMGYHQEVADLEFAQAVTALPSRVIDANLLDDNFDPLLCASSYAIINTVSENYAHELQETSDDALTGWLGHTLQQRGVQLAGVTNGIDPADFDLKNYKKMGLPAICNPQKSPQGIFSCKKSCKKDLITALANHQMSGLQQTGKLDWRPDEPLFTFIGRLSTQKGVDKMIGAIKKMLLIDPNFQILILGSGQEDIESALLKVSKNSETKGRVCLLRGYDTVAATRVYAAGDFFLIPSRYEPCGLTDYYAQLFANIPIVHHIGGLVKVIDGETGFAYQEHTEEALLASMTRAAQLFRDKPKAIVTMRKAAIALINKQYTWDRVKDHYLDLYSKSQAMNKT